MQAQNPVALLGPLKRFAKPGVPKYVALRNAIVDAIASGLWPERARLATEAEYAAALPLSLGTIQRALRALADEGLITRRQKQGSFVAPNRVGRMHAPLHCRFLDATGTAYLPVYPKVLAREAEPRPGAWSAHLGQGRIQRIDRSLRIGDAFTVFGRFWFDADRLPALATLPPRKLSLENFKDIIWREHHQAVGRIRQFLSAVAFPPDVCRATGTRRGTRGQLLEISAYAGRGAPVYYQELYIPPNTCRLYLAADGADPGQADEEPINRRSHP
jgi:DNA-binding GntR family transcriptional regulator